MCKLALLVHTCSGKRVPFYADADEVTELVRDGVQFSFLTPIHIIQICFGITSGRVFDGELLYTKILEVNLFAFAYRLFQSVGKCKQINF